MTPRVDCSVCIANYNGESVLIDCIESVLAQQGEQSVEIIIHDDASTDASLALIKTRYPSAQYPQIRLIESAENAGFCLSNNRMAAVAQGEYILLLNNDAALAPDAISTLFDAAQQQSMQGILTLPQIDWQTDTLVDRGCLLDPFYNPVPNLDPTRTDIAMAIGACLWIPRGLWHKLGGFPTWFESIAEDMQLCCQARLWGYPVQVAKASHYRHRQGTSFGGNRVDNHRLVTTYRRRRLSERNKTYVMILCTPALRLALTLPLHLVLMAFEGALISLLKRDSRPWKEIYAPVFAALWQRRLQLNNARAAIQAQKNTRDYGRAFSWLPHKLILLWRHGVPKIG
ncbi:MAG TPA: glycosyltransferase family 2 protein [Halothiobacillus sp.]|jgi:GT2 family glycosyltransferase|nr:glycosyltransferase family 2 protein [Halothiobacillus sp.]